MPNHKSIETASSTDIVGRVLDIASQDGGRIAIRAEDAEITYAQLAASIRTIATAADRGGIRPGMRVGVITRDPVEDLKVRLALGYLGAVSCAINFNADRAQRSEMATLYGFDMLLESHGCQSGASCATVMSAEWIGLGNDGPPVSRVPHDPNADFMMVLSSGTTGVPTAIVYSSTPLCFSAKVFSQRNLITDRTVFLSQSPHFTNAGAGLPLVILLSGGTVVLLPGTSDLDALVETANAHDISLLFLPPQFAAGLVRKAKARPESRLLPKVGTILIGSDFCSVELLSDVMEWLSPNAVLGYGSSSAGTVSMLYPEDFAARPGSVGRIVPGVTVHIVNGTDAEVSPGFPGRIRVRSPSYPSAVLGPRKVNGEELRDGVCYPGDIGKLDSEGFLYVLGRETDIIRCDGTDVYPAELERRLMSCPGVTEVAVAGVPGDGGTVCPIVFATGSSTLRVEDLAAHLGPITHPAGYSIVPEIPRNAAGKAVKARLVEAYLNSASTTVASGG